MTAPITHPAPAVSVTETSLAQQFMAFDDSTWGIRLSLARNLWAAWKEARREGISQHVFLTRIIGEIQRKGGKNRSVNGLYHYLYAGCADDAGFSFPDLDAGQLIGKALDRLGLTPEVVQSHLDAGNLAEVVAKSRAPTTTLRVTAEARDALDDAARLARATLNTDGMSEPEVRAILPRAYQNASPQVREFLLKLGNGDVNPEQTFIVQADGKAPIANAAPPLSYLFFLKRYGVCWVCGKPPKERGYDLHAHHVAFAGHEARRNDGGPEKFAGACPQCHIPQPFSERVTAHSSAFSIGMNPERMADFMEYDAAHVDAYQAKIGAVKGSGEVNWQPPHRLI